MNAKKFSEAMGELDSRYVDEAIRYKGRSGGSWTRWGTLAACFCLVLGAALGIPKLMQHSGISTVLPDDSIEPPQSYSSVIPSQPEPGSTAGSASQDEANKQRGENVFIDKAMTLEEAQRSEPFGGYLPARVLAGFTADTIQRYQDENDNYLYGLWTKGEGSFDEISWRVSFYDETMTNRITSVDDTKNYDLSLYPFPLADSVPEELFEIVDHPIFPIDELTLEAVSRRAYSVNERGDTNGTRMSFGGCYGDVVVEVTTKGVPVDWVYEQLIHRSGN